MAPRLALRGDLARSELRIPGGNFRTRVNYRLLDNLQAFQRGIEQEGGVAFHLILPNLIETPYIANGNSTHEPA